MGCNIEMGTAFDNSFLKYFISKTSKNVDPIVWKNRVINKSLLISDVITFFFNPIVNVTLLGEELKSALGKKGDTTT